MRGQLRAAPEYSAARTALADEQRRRIRQIRLAAARELVPSHEVGRFLVAVGEALRVRLLSIENRMRSQFPGLDAAVYEFVRTSNEDALRLLSADVAKLEEGE